ncbi:hypothetical protein Poly30_23740 [Planctomycetes bacterium Poly30]|uniref:Uncharacterized protein n=1 Tax=Saltatorellus ferox TaxID=2528018 RepID=A0A518ERZ1_9BACT|nr:hypothetical protein Poly30_23740 [Planctomycetes bacterium Poly30]
MITTKQKWALGGLITLSAAVWTPQIMARFGGTTSAQLGVDAGPGEDEMLTIELGTTAPSPRPSTVRTNPPPAQGPSEGAYDGPAGSSPAAAETATDPLAAPAPATGSRAIVSEVLRTLRQSEAFGIAEEADAATALMDSEGPVSEPDRPPALFTYLETHPLRGTIVGETMSVALIGQNRVRLGEMVPGTSATLVSVERGRATLEEGDITIELELAPLRTSTRLMAERDLQRQNAGAIGQGSSSAAGIGMGASGSFDADSAYIPTVTTPLPAGNPSNTVPTGSAGDF